MRNLFSLAKDKGIQDVEIYTGLSKTTSIKTFNGEKESYQISEQNVTSIRGIVNGKMGYVYTEDLNESPEVLLEKLILNASIISSDDYEEIFAGSDTYPEVPELYDGTSPTFQEAMDKLSLAEETARATSKYVKEVSCSYQESESKVTIENSKGLTLSRTDHYFYIVGSIVCRDKDQTSNVWEVEIKKNFKELDAKRLGTKAAQEAEAKLGAKPCASKEYKILLKNDAMNSILAVLGSLFYGENVQKGLSPLKGKEQTNLVGSNITLIDDPFLKEGLNQFSFDDEGVRASKTYLVKNGVLTSFLHNLKSAHKAEVASTGNGFKGGVASKVGTSSTNLYIEAGTTPFEELVKKVHSGLLITDVSGTHAGINSYNGDFSLQSEGFMIEDGKITSPVKLITIAGNIFEMLHQVETLGSDIKHDYNGIGSPSMIITSLPVSGN